MGTDELVDVVDEHDVVIETVTRRTVRADVLRHRAVYIVVTSSRGELLVHQRSFEKDVAPGWWDVAAGGVVGHGESYENAAHRELTEELGVTASLETIAAGSFDHADVHIVGRAFLARHDGPFTFTDGEIIAANWVPLAEIDTHLAEPGRTWCPDSIAIALRPFLATVQTRSQQTADGTNR